MTIKILIALQDNARSIASEHPKFKMFELSNSYLNHGEKEQSSIEYEDKVYDLKKVKRNSRGALSTAIYRLFEPPYTKETAQGQVIVAIAILLIYVMRNEKEELEYNLNSDEGIETLRQDIDQFYSYLRNNKHRLNKDNSSSTFARTWLVYIRNTLGVHRTFLDIKKDKEEYRATYLSDKGYELNGPVFYDQDQLIVTLNTKKLPGYYLTLRARVSGQALNKKQARISGIAIANGEDANVNFALPFILFYDQNEINTDLFKFQTAKSRSDFEETENQSLYFVPSEKDELDIVQFLALERALYTTHFPPGIDSIPSSALSTKILNLGRDSYTGACGKFLKGSGWVSLTRKGSRTSSDLIVRYWSFSRDDIKQSIKAKVFLTPDRSGQTYYEGEVKVFNNEYWIHLTRGINQKFLFGRKSEEDPTAVLLIGSYEDEEDHRRYATREILIPENYLNGIQPGKSITHDKNYPDNENDYPQLSYKDFSMLKQPSDFVKMYLNYKNHGRLSYPRVRDEKSRYGQERKAIPYKGRYFVYVAGVYPENKGKVV